jgi:hypothetical protein
MLLDLQLPAEHRASTHGLLLARLGGLLAGAADHPYHDSVGSSRACKHEERRHSTKITGAPEVRQLGVATCRFEQSIYRMGYTLLELNSRARFLKKRLMK